MNLKLVVASMSILGLVSCPVFAATNAKRHHHMKKHHHMMKHHTMNKEVAYHDYKDMGSLPIQPAPVVCTMSQAEMVLAMSNQNLDRMANRCNPGWFNRLQFSGGITVDVGKWGRRTNFMGENYERLSLNDAHLDVTATVNDWAHAFASISYNTATINDPTAVVALVGPHVAEYDAAYSNNANGGANNALQLEQAYATLGNLNEMPVYIQVGKQFQDFGRYTLHPITEPMTQVMSKTLATSAKIGFIANGFNGSLAAFDNPTPKIGQTKRPTDYVAALGFIQPSDQMAFDVGIGYIYDLNGVNDIAYATNQFNIIGGNGNGFNRRTGGFALYGDVSTGPFMIGARWTGASKRFNVADLPRNGVADIDPTTGDPFADARGARPWAAGIQAGFVFDPIIGCHKNNIYVGYQASRQAAGLMLPRSRWVAGYEFDYWKSTKLALEWDRDIAYSVSRGGSGRNSNLVSLRAGVAFG